MAVNGINGDYHVLMDDDNRTLSPDIDIYTAARHGTAATVSQLSQLADNGADDLRLLRRGAVESTPAHDAAATGNIATLSWLLADTSPLQLPMYLPFFFACLLLLQGHVSLIRLT